MMAKPKKGKKVNIDAHGTILIPVPKSIPNREHLQRLNYLYQLSTFQTMEIQQDKANSLARMYAKNLDLIQKKTKCGLTPGLKRTMCKKCHRTLIPTKTVKHRIVNNSRRGCKSNDILMADCVCGAVKRFPVGRNPSYETYCERDGNLHLLSAGRER